MIASVARIRAPRSGFDDMHSKNASRLQLANEYHREQVDRLLRRYPDIDSTEKAVILTFLKRAPALEIGLLTSDKAIRPQLQRFRQDHACELSLGIRGLAIASAIVIAIVLACILLWDVGVNG